MEELYIKLGGNGDNAQVWVNGDFEILCKMIGNAMEADKDVAALFIASVMMYAHDRGWNCGDLESMIKLGR